MTTSEPLRTRLSDDLEVLLKEQRPMSLGEIEARLKGRGFALLIMLLSAPFLLPIVPGSSTPFGLAIAIMGLRITAGRKPWLPQFVLRRQLSWKTLEKVIGLLLRISRWMERWVKPRMHFLQRWPGMMNLIGFGIFAGGAFLLLPLPIPLSNTFPACSILLLAAGMMERDGLLILAGYAMGVFAWVYLAIWMTVARQGFDWVHRLF